MVVVVALGMVSAAPEVVATEILEDQLFKYNPGQQREVVAEAGTAAVQAEHQAAPEL